MRGPVVIAIVASLAAPARADDDARAAADMRAAAELAEARRLEAALDYLGALAIVERILDRGNLEMDRYVELHVLAGKLAGGLERPQLAETHFARALAVRPTVVLPAGISPKVTGPFDVARARSLPLSLNVTRTETTVALNLETDPLGLVVGIEVETATGMLAERVTRRLAVPEGGNPMQAYALDAVGNRVWTGPVPLLLTRDRTALRTDDRRLGGDRYGMFGRWPAWAVITGVAVGTGIFATVKFRSAQSDFDRLQRAGDTDFTVLEDLESRGRRWGWTANLAFGAGVVTGLVTLAFTVRGDHGPIAFRVTPGPGTGLAISGGF